MSFGRGATRHRAQQPWIGLYTVELCTWNFYLPWSNWLDLLLWHGARVQEFSDSLGAETEKTQFVAGRETKAGSFFSMGLCREWGTLSGWAVETVSKLVSKVRKRQQARLCIVFPVHSGETSQWNEVSDHRSRTSRWVAWPRAGLGSIQNAWRYGLGTSKNLV